ncbi:MAG TPA: EthD family reductase [Burkholderiales bacterium]|nr:EthD family reductase [Burkholderiales bacterium]
MVSLFIIFRRAVNIEDGLLRSTGMKRAHIYTPQRVNDPFIDDGAPPPLVLQLYFDELPVLEKACAGPLQEFETGAAQAMTVRRFPLPNPGQPGCTYLVAYEGPAEDEHAWHSHYLAHHPPLMARLPGIRELEVYTPLQWIAPLSWQRANCMQRNKVAFDSAEALTAALRSPVRHEMRADFHSLPAFSGAVTHFAMATRVLSS